MLQQLFLPQFANLSKHYILLYSEGNWKRIRMARERIPIFLMGLLLWCCLTASAKAEYVKYKDPKQPLPVRIQDLLNRMTLEEKIGQMVQIDRRVASAEVMKKYFIGKHHPSLFFNNPSDQRK